MRYEPSSSALKRSVRPFSPRSLEATDGAVQRGQLGSRLRARSGEVRSTSSSCRATSCRVALDEVLLEGQVKDALIRLNPEIEADPDEADEVIYNLRAILISARTSPHPVVANEEFMAWLTGQKSMPFGPNGEHTTVRLIDFDHPEDDVVEPVDGLHRGHLQAGPGREAVRSGAVVQRVPPGRRRGEDAGPACVHVDRRRGADPRRLRAERAAVLRAQRVLLRHRGQGLPLRHRRHAGRTLGPVARGRDRPRRSGEDRACCSQGGCRRRPQARGRAGLPAVLHASTPPTRSTARSRSSPGSSSSRQPT